MYTFILYGSDIIYVQKMAKKDKRPTAKHMLAFLEQNKGFAIRFSHILREMQKKGYKHNASAISQNLTYLVDQKKIVNIKRNLNFSFYGIPEIRPDGTTFIVAKKVYVENEIVEL